MKNGKILMLAAMAGLLLVSGCKKKFDLPPEPAPLANSGPVTIDSLIRKYVSYYITSTVSPTQLFRFSDDATLTCTVTADETSGNIYKAVYIEDATGTMIVKLLNSSGLFVGDQIRINLRNIALNDYGKMIQLDSVDIEKSVTKLSSGHLVTPTKMTFNQIATFGLGGLRKYQGKLILLDSVEFSNGAKGKTFADTINKFSLDKILLNTAGTASVTVRTSGYANFAKNKIPCGEGSIIALVGEYNGDIQLTIRDFNEVKLTNDNCPIIVKSYDDETIEMFGWISENVTGTIEWTVEEFSGRKFANITNYPSNQTCETWLISPPFDITNSPNPNLSFMSAYKYGTPGSLQVLVSTNYVSGNPNAATWTNLNPTLSSGNFQWTNSGTISLSSYKTSGTRVAFKYNATGSGSTWEIDDIAVFGQ